MPKVQCGKCANWLNSGTQRLRRGATLSLSFNYEYVGTCMNDKAAIETSGYTGIASGHKMTRREKAKRYCNFFRPLGETEA